jgi:peptidyl-Asp metalloendopeptidase
MRIYLAAIALTGTLLAGCSSDWDAARNAKPSASADQGDEMALPTAALAARNAPESFASLPDRGELLSYAKDREVRRSGAYTSHPVEISEAHALNAIAAGGLRLTTPDGKPVNVTYDRIEEHPDGNWTWVGQSESGDHAVLTFGESSVFGEIFTDGQALRVTTRNGSAWVVETDHASLAGRHPGQHGDGPEFLIPPRSDEPGMEMAGAKAMAAAGSSVETKNSGAVIDLALGYTGGFVTAYGNQATAVTRLTSLVALGNAAYQRSGVNMRVRLVHAMQVNFTDTTDNADALQKLTGYNATTRQRTTPDPAFNALRAARDEYGADLVSLVRPHRSPEQKGCGIAWLLGAGQTAITAADEEFGYSVVSDGADVDEGDGNTYFCSDYSLVHELGHTMGQAHNQADAQYAGAHAYSYGYREASTTGFHTIMAYPLANSSQVEAPYFATPLINFAAGRPYGVANTSDNVRSMNQTMPIIGAFRATVVPIPGDGPAEYSVLPSGDFDADGVFDLLWRNNTTGANVIWKSGGTVSQTLPTTVNPNLRIVGVGDLNKDGRSDIVWRNISTGQNVVWYSANSATTRGLSTVASQDWQIVWVGDFDGDGASDLLWRNFATGANTLWKSGGSVSQAVTALGLDWKVVAAGDFNGDGKDDIVWRNFSTGQNVIWLSANSATTMALATVLSQEWKVIGAGDFNGDGTADLFWRNTTTGANVIWRSGSISQTVSSVTDQNWQIAGIGDFNGDGRADLTWRNRSTGANVQWLSTGSGFTSRTLSSVASQNWNIVP